MKRSQLTDAQRKASDKAIADAYRMTARTLTMQTAFAQKMYALRERYIRRLTHSYLIYTKEEREDWIYAIHRLTEMYSWDFDRLIETGRMYIWRARWGYHQKVI